MRKSIQLQIAEPCHENWHRMTPREQGRFCAACNKTVVDFTCMTDKEILRHIACAPGNTCGRFTKSQLEKQYALNAKQKRKWWVYCWNMLVATFLFSGQSYAQGSVKLVGKTKTAQTRGETEPIQGSDSIHALRKSALRTFIRGQVLNSRTNEAVSDASIFIDNTSQGLAADEEGRFTIPVKDNGNKEILLQISAIGFASQQVLVKTNNLKADKNLTFYLEEAASQLDSVVVTAENESICFRGKVGGLFVVRSISIFTLIEDSLFSRKEMKVFPNPVNRGEMIRLSFPHYENGEYSVILLNSSGQLIQSKKINLSHVNQVELMAIDNRLPAGIYTISLQHVISKKMTTKKLVVK